MNEFELIRAEFNRGRPFGPDAPLPAGVLLGIGDDAALMQIGSATLVVSTDMLIEGRHFFAGTAPEAIGHKSLAVNLSDLAAMGARPRGFTLAVALPSADRHWVSRFCRGLFALADESRCPLVGGDTTRGPLTVCITVLGEVDGLRALRRHDARDGDDLWVSGPLGGAAWTVAQRQRDVMASPSATAPSATAPSATAPSAADRVAAARRLDWPRPRLSLGRALVGTAHAAMDVSDGLAGDVAHLLEQSSRAGGMSLQVVVDEPAIPYDAVLRGLDPQTRLRHALSGGDDYELVFTAPPHARRTIEAIGRTEAAAGLPAPVRIGQIRAGREAVVLRMADGSERPHTAGGHDHFGPAGEPERR